MVDRNMIIGIDLGGTRFRVCITDSEGTILRRQSWSTNAEEGAAAVISRMAAAVRDLAAPEGLDKVVGVGLGAPGPLDPWQGIIRNAPNLPGWVDVPLRRMMQDQLGVDVQIGNDANLAALGELRFGAARGLKHMVYLTVSTGIGGGVIVDGHLLLGATGLAAELGHMAIAVGGPQCGCGNYGCLEAMASGTAIAREARERMSAGAPTAIWDAVQGDLERVDAIAVEVAAKQGDAFALEVFREAATYLGIGVVNVLHIFDPEMVVIGGGVSQAGELLFGPVFKAIETRAMPAYRERARIVPAALGDDAGLMGAVALILAEAQP